MLWLFLNPDMCCFFLITLCLLFYLVVFIFLSSLAIWDKKIKTYSRRKTKTIGWREGKTEASNRRGEGKAKTAKGNWEGTKRRGKNEKESWKR